MSTWLDLWGLGLAVIPTLPIIGREVEIARNRPGEHSIAILSQLQPVRQSPISWSILISQSSISRPVSQPVS